VVGLIIFRDVQIIACVNYTCMTYRFGSKQHFIYFICWYIFVGNRFTYYAETFIVTVYEMTVYYTLNTTIHMWASNYLHHVSSSTTARQRMFEKQLRRR